jgi:hypothetical protein
MTKKPKNGVVSGFFNNALKQGFLRLGEGRSFKNLIVVCVNKLY